MTNPEPHHSTGSPDSQISGMLCLRCDGGCSLLCSLTIEYPKSKIMFESVFKGTLVRRGVLDHNSWEGKVALYLVRQAKEPSSCFLCDVYFRLG